MSEGLAGESSSDVQRFRDEWSHITRQYPRLAKYKVDFRLDDPNIPLHGNTVETVGPGESDKYGKLINPSDDTHIMNIGSNWRSNDRVGEEGLPNMILGDGLHMMRGDPEWDRLNQGVYNLRDESQIRIDDKAYLRRLKEEYGGDEERYPRKKFDDIHRKDAYTRSMVAPDTIQRNPENKDKWTNEIQDHFIQTKMIPYLKNEMVEKAEGLGAES